jgi:hypothetical protein
MKIGIALYTQTDRRNRPISPHWSIVAHENSYNSPDTLIYQISSTQGLSGFKLNHVKCNPFVASSLIGILHVADITITRAALEKYAMGYNEKRDAEDESGLMMWSCEGWSIRFLRGLQMQIYFPLPCDIPSLYDWVKKRLPVMKQAFNQTGRAGVLNLSG